MNGTVNRFSESAPRPPVFPGEENVAQVKMDQWTARFGWANSGRRVGGGNLSPSKGTSPVLTPRRHGHHHHQSQHQNDSDTSRRYEAAEGSASTSPPIAETPPYLRWAENLHFLLADPDGVELFEKFLEQENCSHLLKFWFACEGLKRQWSEDADRAVQIIQVIHKKYIRLRRINVTDAVRKEVNERMANKATLDAHIFDEAQKEVESLIRDSVYVNFLSSDVYLSYIQSMQNGFPDSPRSGRSGSDVAGGSKPAAIPTAPVGEPSVPVVVEERPAMSTVGPLPTLHEDSEFSYPPPSVEHSNVKSMPPTRKTIMATIDNRMDVESRPHSGRTSSNPYHMHPYYAPYNPAVSRQDSEISSDCHTDDTRSLTDSSVDGSMLFYPVKPTKHQLRKAQAKIHRDCMVNRDMAAVNQPFIPRTHRPPPKEQMTPQQPQEFAALLIQKLEAVKRERESEEKLLRMVTERDSEASGLDESFGPSVSGGPSRMMMTNRPESSWPTPWALADALSKIVPSNETDNQSILDNHVQRVWADQTPLRSPGAPSPRPWSPEQNRRRPPVVGLTNLVNPAKVGSSAGLPSGPVMRDMQPQRYPSAHHPHRRKDKDMEKGSVYSTDSGAIMEPPHFSKSQQSIADARRVGGASGNPSGGGGVGGVGSAFSGGSKNYDRVHDSGLCLHDSASSAGMGQSGLMAPPPVPSKEKVMNWMTQSDRWQEQQHQDPSVKHRSSRPTSSTSPTSGRRSTRTKQQPYGASRSESLERAAAAEEERNRPFTKPKPGNAAVSSVSTASGQPMTVAKKPAVPAEGGASSSAVECTVVMFTFGDEPVPYRSRVPGRSVTLKQFKEMCLPKKGNYKYYFKTNCEDDVALAVNQEVIDDSEVLPLWEDKVLGIVKLVD